jgi:hypothetical protein
MKKANLNSIASYRTNGEFVAKSTSYREANGLKPHNVWRSKKEGVDHNRGLLIAVKKNNKDHWAVNKSAIEFILKAETEKHIDKGYLLMEDEEGNVVRYHTINQVYEAIKGQEPNQGVEWGPYYYFDEELKIYAPGKFKPESDRL